MDGWMDNDSLLCISMCSPPFLPPWLHRVRRNVFHPPEYLDTSRQAYWTHYTVPPPLYPSCWSTFTQNPTRSFFFWGEKQIEGEWDIFGHRRRRKRRTHCVSENDVMAWNRIRQGSLFYIYCDGTTCWFRNVPSLDCQCARDFRIFCLASVWKRADSTHHLKGHDDSMLFFFPSKILFRSWPRSIPFFSFHFMFFIYFYYWRREEKKIINNKPKKKNKVRAPCVRFLGAKKKKKKKERNVFRFHPLSILARHLQLRLMHKQLETAVSHYNTYIDLVLNGNGAGALSCATISGSAVS